jgi:TolA-binding protein
MVKKYEADPAFLQKLRDNAAMAKAKPALSVAENYAKNGMIPQAKKKYQEVIDQFPDTMFAETAKKALANLK